MNIFIFLLINLRSPGNGVCATQSLGLSNGCINAKIFCQFLWAAVYEDVHIFWGILLDHPTPTCV